MPIHDQGYRRYSGTRLPPGRRWMVIARTGIRQFFRRKVFIGLLLLAFIPFLVRALQIYAATNVPQAKALLQVTPATFKDFLGWQSVFVFFITVYAGAGLIANDRRANALQLYLSKPLTRVEYVFGKLTILMSLLLLVTFVPAIVLVLLEVLFSGGITFLREYPQVLPAILLMSFLQTFASAMTMLALSSLSTSARYVGVLYAVVIFLTEAFYGVLRLVTGGTTIAWVSFGANLTRVSDAIFRVPAEYDTPWTVSLGVVLALIGISIVVLERRIRAVEIVA